MPRNQIEFDDVRMRGFLQRADVADLWRIVDAHLPQLPSEMIGLHGAAGRVLAEGVASPVDVPAFDRSAMDGFAVASAATPGAFTIVGQSLPGRSSIGSVRPGQAVQIMTGAPLPAGADCVAPVEQVAVDGQRVDVLAHFSPGKNVSQRGEDVEAGNIVLNGGRTLRPQDVGLLAAIGASPVAVVRRPQVSILATGDELLPCGSRPEGYRIVDSNSVMLRGLLERDGAEVCHAKIVPDRIDAVRAAIADCSGDMILVTGGSSVGCEDHAPSVVAELGELLVHGVNLRPAGPLGFGVVNDRPIFLIPGNPVACLSAYDVAIRRAIRQMAKRDVASAYRTVRLPLAEDLKSVPGRMDYVRITVCQGAAMPLRKLCGSGASMLGSVTRADGFLLVPSETSSLARGEYAEVSLYDG